MEPGYWKELLRPVFTGRRWLIVADVLAAAGPTARLLADYGAEKPFCIAGSHGSGEPPEPDILESAILGTAGPTIMQGFRNFAAAIAHLPRDVEAHVDAWDPDHSALALAGFGTSDSLVAGRATFGSRWPDWVKVEDKITIDSVWDEAGVERAAREIVPATREELLAAAARLDDGMGTVWTGDNKEGWHGGAEYVRWVTEPAEAAEPIAFMERHCDEVRVMPFLDGIPCSIHGIVFTDQVLTFRPAEIIILRRPGGASLQYAGVSTFWEAPAHDVEYMRKAARRVGAHLREVVGYRGAFGMDGVLTAGGWLPTELNARVSSGLGALVGTLEDVSILNLNRAIIEGLDLDYRPAEFEHVVRAATAATGRGGGHMTFDKVQTENVREEIVFADGAARVSSDGETPDAELLFGPGPQGGFVRVSLDPERTPFGESVAPRTASALMLAGDLWDLGVGTLEPAPDLR